MKRPFALIGFTYLSALILSVYCTAEITRVLIFVFLGLFIISLFFKKIRKPKTIPIAFLTIAIAMLVYSLTSENIVKPIEALNGKDAVISGTICEIPYKSYNKYYYVIETDSVKIDGVDDAPQNIKMRLSISKAFDADVYDKVNGKVHLFTKDPDGAFSSKSSYAAKGIHIFSYLYEFEDYSTQDGDQKPIYYYCLKCRQALESSLRMIFPSKYWPVAEGILLGDTYAIDEDIKSDFRDVGISHLLSVSGFNVSIIAQFFIMILLFFKVPRRWACLFSCFGILLFMGITGFTPSVVRAGIMLILCFIAPIFKLTADSLNSLGFAVLIFTIFKPFSGGDIGLLLSFFATLGIILLSAKLELLLKSTADHLKYGKKALSYLIPSISVTMSATIFILPITMLFFKKFSLVNIIANMLVVFPSMIMLILTLIAAILYLLWPLQFIAMPLGLISGVLINYITACANILAKFPFATVSTSQPFIVFWLGCAALLLAVSLFIGKGTSLVKISAILSCILLFTGVISYQLVTRDLTSLAVLDTGDGCSLVLTKANRSAVISCGGDKIKYNKLSQYLDSQNISNLDCVLLSDFEDETSRYAQNVIDEYNPYYVVLPDRDDIDSKLSKSISDSSTAQYFTSKSTLNFWNNIKICAINSDDQSFLFLTVNDINILICPSGGNAGYIPNEYRNCQIFIEGNLTTSLDKINSTYAIMGNSLDVATKNVNAVAQSGKIPIATAGDGNVIVDFLGGQNVSMRRVK
ncbi:MAG: hypothetical protein RUMPE_00062 [Eubacteriales bacterium SKADARSKE-1]|nr:hypothetical protein [Eubacteriales bacterium SKADARSKE-1]